MKNLTTQVREHADVIHNRIAVLAETVARLDVCRSQAIQARRAAEALAPSLAAVGMQAMREVERHSMTAMQAIREHLEVEMRHLALMLKQHARAVRARKKELSQSLAEVRY